MLFLISQKAAGMRARVACSLLLVCAAAISIKPRESALFSFRASVKVPQIGSRSGQQQTDAYEAAFNALDDQSSVAVPFANQAGSVVLHALPYLPHASGACGGIRHGDREDGCYAITSESNAPPKLQEKHSGKFKAPQPTQVRGMGSTSPVCTRQRRGRRSCSMAGTARE